MKNEILYFCMARPPGGSPLPRGKTAAWWGSGCALESMGSRQQGGCDCKTTSCVSWLVVAEGGEGSGSSPSKCRGLREANAGILDLQDLWWAVPSPWTSVSSSRYKPRDFPSLAACLLLLEFMSKPSSIEHFEDVIRQKRGHKCSL